MRLPASLFALHCALALAACDGGGEDSETNASASTSGADTSATESETGLEGSQRFCADADADGFADLDQCEDVATGEVPPAGSIPEADVATPDCDDADASAFPGAAPLDDPAACMRDGDDDDFGSLTAAGAVAPGSDCDDADPLILDCSTRCADADADGYGDPDACVDASPGDPLAPGQAANALDCVDTAFEVHTGAAASEAHLCTADLDADGYGDPEASIHYPGAEDGSDCDDADADVIVCVDAGGGCFEAVDGEAQLAATAVGGSGGYLFDWSPPESVDDPNSPTPTANPSQTTLYTVRVSDGLGNTGADTATVHVSDADWTLVDADDPGAGCEIVGLIGAPASFASADDGARACTLSNSAPTALVCANTLEQTEILAQLAVETDADNDFIGLVWGWQSPDQFYLLTWKRHAETWSGCAAPAGITVKRVDRQAAFVEADFACAETTRNASALLTPDQTTTAGWIPNQRYAVRLGYAPNQTSVEITDEAMQVVASFVVDDASYPRGRFGAYAHSEQAACAGPFSARCL